MDARRKVLSKLPKAQLVVKATEMGLPQTEADKLDKSALVEVIARLQELHNIEAWKVISNG